MKLVRKTAATASCVTAAQVLANQRTKSTSENDLIELWIKAAEEMVEARTNRSIMQQTFVLTVPAVLTGVTLFRPPMAGDIAVVSAKTTIGDATTTHGVETLVLGTDDMLPTVRFPAILEAAAGSAVIEYRSGSASAQEVPAMVKQAVLLLASHWYRNREAVVTDQRRGTGVALPYGVDSLIAPLRIPNVGVSPNEA